MQLSYESCVQLVMDVEGFDTYAELLKFLDNGNFTDKAFSEEKIELSDAKPVYLPDGFKLINQGTSQVARSITYKTDSSFLNNLLPSLP